MSKCQGEIKTYYLNWYHSDSSAKRHGFFENSNESLCEAHRRERESRFESEARRTGPTAMHRYYALVGESKQRPHAGCEDAEKQRGEGQIEKGPGREARH